MPNTLVTHAGAFHADDLLSYVILSDLYPEATLLRTRDQNLLETHKGKSIMFDTGGSYDPAKHIYDHHQPDAPKRDDGTPYAAFGLVWKHFGTRWLVNTAGVPKKHAHTVWQGIDDTLVRQVDTVDNGVIENYNSIETDITTLIFRDNPSSLGMDGQYYPPSDAARDAAFKHTKSWVQPLLRGHAQSLARDAIGKDVVQKALDARPFKELVVLDTPVPWTKSLFACQGHESARLVTFPTGTNNEWALQTIPTKPQGLTARQWFPKAWRGLRGADMAKASGVNDAHFCHAGGFFCATTGKDAAIELAQATVKTWARTQQQER